MKSDEVLVVLFREHMLPDFIMNINEAWTKFINGIKDLIKQTINACVKAFEHLSQLLLKAFKKGSFRSVIYINQKPNKKILKKQHYFKKQHISKYERYQRKVYVKNKLLGYY